jgi:hypothetical protein
MVPVFPLRSAPCHLEPKSGRAVSRRIQAFRNEDSPLGAHEGQARPRSSRTSECAHPPCCRNSVGAQRSALGGRCSVLGARQSVGVRSAVGGTEHRRTVGRLSFIVLPRGNVGTPSSGLSMRDRSICPQVRGMSSQKAYTARRILAVGRTLRYTGDPVILPNLQAYAGL